MPRRGRISKRKGSADPKFGSLMVQKFVNKLMIKGKKATAEKIFYGAMEQVAKKSSQDPMGVFEKALKNITPFMEVKSRRVGGSTYQIPIEVTKDRGTSIAMKWLRMSAQERQGRSMAEKLASEIMDASNGTGGAAKKREDLHKTAEANKAFAHFRW